MKVPVDLLYRVQIFKPETYEIEWRLAEIVGDHEGSVEAVVTEQFELLGIVVACEGFLLTFHVENVEIKVSSTRILDVLFVGPRAGLHGVERGAVNTKIRAFVSFTDQTLEVCDVVLEDRDPSLLVMMENFLQVVLLVRHFL